MVDKNYSQCQVCKEWVRDDSHVCPPLWTVAEVQWYHNKLLMISHHDVYASTAEDAAALFAEQEDVESAEYTFIQRGGKVAVFPKGPPTKIELFEIQGEIGPQYTARAIEYPEAIDVIQESYDGGIL